MFQGVLSRPRPAPRKLVPLAAGGAIVLLALPVFAVLGWTLEGWGLGAVLWVAGQALGLVLSRLSIGLDNLGSSGVLAFGMMLRTIAVMVVIIAVAVSNKHVGLAAAAVYALAYTSELGLSLVSYFSGPAKEIRP